MLPKKGKKLHPGTADLALAKLLADALRDDLGPTHQAAKTAMRWTGASERSVKHWMAASYAPSAAHLVALMRHSDGVLGCLLEASGRQNAMLAVELGTMRSKLLEIVAMLDLLISGASDEGS